jgi:sec-independent protein translocase protein TatB
VFGVSFTEMMLIAAVALIVVGPRRLPEMLGTAGKWIGKLRTITSEMRRQTGIDDILRQEGIQGGLNELRTLMRPGIGNLASLGAAGHTTVPAMSPSPRAPDPYGDAVDFDRDREYPTEGADAYGAIPEDLLELASEVATAVVASPTVAVTEPAGNGGALPAAAAEPPSGAPALPAANVEPAPAPLAEPRAAMATDPGPIPVLEPPGAQAAGDKGAE